MKFVFLALLVSAVASQSCYDSSDSLIGTRCYKFINQKLSWQDAWNWCHSRTSYLATVDNTSNNFVASTARTIFNDNEGKFWIGLSRSNNKWTWDDGTPFAWFNWETQNSQNYATESIKNGKWNAYTPDTRLNFVCSYFPGGGPTPAASTIPDARTTPDPGTTSYVTPTDGGCTRRTNSTIFLAYSTDIDQFTFDNVRSQVLFWNSPPLFQGYSMFANVRLDVKEEEEVQYHSDIFSFNVSISTRRPDQSLGYQNSATGSNVYRMIQKFLKNTQVTLCGTLMYIVIKRYPNESDVSDIITQLRANNIFAYVVVHDFPSGGNNPGTLFDMSSKTNGYCIFDHGPNFWLAASQVAYPISSPNQFISHNYVVSGSGRIQIPAFQTPAPNSYGEQVLVAITCQNHTLDSSFISVNYTIQSLDGSWKFTGPDIGGDQGWWQEGTGIIAYPQINGSTSYTWTIDYHYANNEPQFIQARMYSYYYHDFLPLPSY